MDMPWTDRAGRFSALRLAAFLGVVAPALWLAGRAGLGDLGPRPWEEAVHVTGIWALRFLVITLAITPLRFAGLPRLVILRRMLGLAAMFYGLAHLGLFGLQTGELGKWLLEIISRWYLVVGLVALSGLVALGITSRDAAIRSMGRNWQRLHRLVWPIAVLALLHFYMQSKIDVSEPVLMTGLVLLLWLARRARARGLALAQPLVWLGLGLVAGGATALVEAGWYALATGAPAGRVLAANLDFAYTIRPAWWVAGTGAALALAEALRVVARRVQPGRRQPG